MRSGPVVGFGQVERIAIGVGEERERQIALLVDDDRTAKPDAARLQLGHDLSDRLVYGETEGDSTARRMSLT